MSADEEEDAQFRRDIHHRLIKAAALLANAMDHFELWEAAIKRRGKEARADDRLARQRAKAARYRANHRDREAERNRRWRAKQRSDMGDVR